MTLQPRLARPGVAALRQKFSTTVGVGSGAADVVDVSSTIVVVDVSSTSVVVDVSVDSALDSEVEVEVVRVVGTSVVIGCISVDSVEVAVDSTISELVVVVSVVVDVFVRHRPAEATAARAVTRVRATRILTDGLLERRTKSRR